jgi:hypothetical protein
MEAQAAKTIKYKVGDVTVSNSCSAGPYCKPDVLMWLRDSIAATEPGGQSTGALFEAAMLQIRYARYCF